MEFKKCSTCKQKIAIEHFRSDKSKKDGLTTRCQVCDKAATWRTINKPFFMWLRKWSNSQLPKNKRVDL